MTPPASIDRDLSWRSLSAIFWSLVAAAPFLLFPLIHAQRLGDTATGFTTYDLPYYVANAQAILDRGHAGCYPNPFDPDPAAPAIYFHWLMLVLAALIGPLGLGPGDALLLLQVCGAFASARVMYSLVAWLIPASRWHIPLFLLAMWSGGLLILGRLLVNVTTGSAWNHELLAFDPGQGLWCLNFGRNLILPTEAIYHALMLGLWLAILQRLWRVAVALLVSIASTHPFTGAQALAIVAAYLSACELLPASQARGRPPRAFLIACGLTGLAFGIYYFLFLPRFPQHREIQQTWTLGWTLTGPTILLAYTPVAILAWLAIRNDSTWRRQIQFLLIAAAVSFLLANHHWFLTPRQPIHFTRGYIWTPLFLVGLPTLAKVFDWLSARLKRAAPFAMVSISALAISDNAGFIVINATAATPPGFSLSADEQAVLSDLRKRQFKGVLLTDDDRMGYLAAAMTSARPWIGHKYNTPVFDARQTTLAAFKSTTAAGELLDDVDLALTTDPRVVRRLEDNGWARLSTHGAIQIWGKQEF